MDLDAQYRALVSRRARVPGGAHVRLNESGSEARLAPIFPGWYARLAAVVLAPVRRKRRPRRAPCRNRQTSLYVAPSPQRRLRVVRALRLAVQDAALSRRKHGFESRRARQRIQWDSKLGVRRCLSSVHPAFGSRVSLTRVCRTGHGDSRALSPTYVRRPQGRTGNIVADTTIIVANCPRCRSNNMTFDVLQTISTTFAYGWKRSFEAFCLCRNCSRSTTFVIGQRSDADGDYLERHPPTTITGSLNRQFEIEGYISLKDGGAMSPPEFVPEPIANAFREGATSVVTGCPNAAGAMFRLAVDLTTRPLLPPENAPEPNRKVRRDLGLRLPWLFQNGLLPRDLEDLSHCIREDGNDGAHAGSLRIEDALDLQDFTAVLLERVFTEPERLKAAAQRRIKRRAGEQDHK